MIDTIVVEHFIGMILGAAFICILALILFMSLDALPSSNAQRVLFGVGWLASIAMLFMILLSVTGCASTNQVQPDPCISEGGIWYKGPNDRDHYCVDKQSVSDEIGRIVRRLY